MYFNTDNDHLRMSPKEMHDLIIQLTNWDVHDKQTPQTVEIVPDQYMDKETAEKWSKKMNEALNMLCKLDQDLHDDVDGLLC